MKITVKIMSKSELNERKFSMRKINENRQHIQVDTGRTTRNVYNEIPIRSEQTQRESSQSRVKSRAEQKENKVTNRDYEKRSERQQRENFQAVFREEG